MVSIRYPRIVETVNRKPADNEGHMYIANLQSYLNDVILLYTSKCMPYGSPFSRTRFSSHHKLHSLVKTGLETQVVEGDHGDEDEGEWKNLDQGP